jgi:hypothetical protein
MKECIKCLETKTLDSFDKQRNVCKVCRNKQKMGRPKRIYTVSVVERFCKKCNTNKLANEFNIDSSRITGLHPYCNSCRSSANKQRYEKNPEIKKEQASIYYINNKRRALDNQNKRHNIRRKTDPSFLLRRRLRNRLYCALKSKGWGKNNKFVEYIGCTQNELMVHIEKQFTEGMSWLNVGKWHIDHIIPLSSAQTEEEMYKLCHYTNLQPLWALDNIKKGNK